MRDPVLDRNLDEACAGFTGDKGFCVNLCDDKIHKTNGWAYPGRASKKDKMVISIVRIQKTVLDFAEVIQIL